MAEHFVTYDWRHGKLADCDPAYPTTLSCWTGDIDLPASGAHFGLVVDGPAEIACDAGRFTLGAGLYFCVPGALAIVGGRGVLMTRTRLDAPFQIGGPVEETGRLKYIDGCTDSLLIGPSRMGDPCLNLLYFPPGIDQTSHTHPSDRIGIVLSGRGECVTPAGVTALEPGVIFCIPTDGEHKFRTTDSPMRVVAYHPDSDFGPTDEDHPMLNRTMVDGVSAARIDDIRTKDKAPSDA